MKHLNGLDATKTTPIGNKQHPTADGLVDKAHRNAIDRGFYIVGYDVQPLLLPTAELPMCIFKAVIEVKSDYEPENGVMRFTGIGDATPTNCTSQNTAAAYPRMAETRAMGRAISAAFNVSEAMAEEMLAAGVAGPAYAAPAAVAPGAAPPGIAAPAGAPPVAAPAGAAPAGVNFNGQTYLRANGQEMKGYAKEGKGHSLASPLNDVGLLQWYVEKAMLSDKVTPDWEFRNAAQAEIARRNGTPPTITVQAQTVAAPAVAPPPLAAPGLAPPAGQPAGVAPAAMPAAPPPPVGAAPAAAPSTPPPPVATAGPWVPTAQDLQHLATGAAAKGHDWNAMTAYVQQNFGGRIPQQLSKPEFNSVLVAYGAAQLP
jgi:hypothetical protein